MAFSFFKHPKINTAGFTFIELLIVITIMGILTATIAFSIREMIYRGKVAKAQGDINRIAKALRQLEIDTGRTAAYKLLNGVNGCTTPSSGDEFTVNLSADNVGIYRANVAGGTFNNWKGPYIEGELLDPWGRPYVYDGDYYCARNSVSKQAKGCEKYVNKAPNDHQQVIYSQGEVTQNISDGSVAYDADNIVLVLCSE